MKSVKTDKLAAVTYPCLMVGDSGGVILMVAYGEGVVVVPDSASPLGEFSKIWMQRNLTPYTGTVTLSNDGAKT